MKIALTGAFGYSGQHIARMLLDEKHDVVTLTNTNPSKTDPFGGAVKAFPLNFNDLTDALSECDVLINTYWVRFNHKNFSHKTAVRNTGLLFGAAKKAGVKRIVHTSIANPSIDSPFEYYRCKAEMEDMLKNLGMAFSVLRPTVLFGENDILINNIAWTLRRFPIVGYFGNGMYRIRPIHVQDFAKLAAESIHDVGNKIVDAVGPEDFTYRELLKIVGKTIGCNRILMRVPVFAGFLVTQLVGFWQNDVFLTREEIGGLMANLLTTNAPASGSIKLSEWLQENSKTVGIRYASELARRR